jgi:hypothetical protein
MKKPEGIHYLQICDDRKQSPLRRKCIESLKAIVRPDVDEYEMVCFRWVDNPFQRVQIAEEIRFQKAKNIPNLCYVDTDCFIHRAFRPKEGQPYFAQYAFNDSDPGIPDIFYFFVNGCNDYFVKNFSNLKNANNAYSIDIQVLRSLTSFGIIPENSYVHCYSTMNYLFERQFEKKSEQANSIGINVDELEIAALRKNIEMMVLNMKTFDELRRSQNG